MLDFVALITSVGALTDMVTCDKNENSDHELARKAYFKEDYDKAYNIWLENANNGDMHAQAWIGSMYANGDGREANSDKAFLWYLSAAKQGYAMAQANVGVAYYTGNGTDKNLANAIKWFKKAANLEDLNGLFNLAVLYSKGEVSKNNENSQKKAASLYKKASERGHYPSQSRLGYMYSVGIGVRKDRVQAYLWLTLASQHGIGTALTALESVIESMSSEEKAAGISLFEEWRKKTKSNEGPTAIYPTPK